MLEVTHQDHSTGITLLQLLRATYTRVLFFAHIPFMMNCTFNATLTDRLQHRHFTKMIPEAVSTVEFFITFQMVYHQKTKKQFKSMANNNTLFRQI